MREIDKVKPGTHGCCPGHDCFPSDTYRGKRSKKARSRDRKVEHRYIRHLLRERMLIEGW